MSATRGGLRRAGVVAALGLVMLAGCAGGEQPDDNGRSATPRLPTAPLAGAGGSAGGTGSSGTAAMPGGLNSPQPIPPVQRPDAGEA